LCGITSLLVAIVLWFCGDVYWRELDNSETFAIHLSIIVLAILAIFLIGGSIFLFQ